MLKALLITNSPELRETVEILLGDQFVVEHVSTRALPPAVPDDTSILIADGAELGAEALPDGAAPVLWVGARPTRALAASTRRRERAIAAAFEAFAFREAVRGLIDGSEARESPARQGILRFPYFPEAAIQVARRAVAAPVPLVISGEAGSGKMRLARAIHAQRGAAYLLTPSPEDLGPRLAELLPATLREADEVTVAVGDLAALAAARQRVLIEMLETGVLTTPAGIPLKPRLISLTTRDPALLIREGSLQRTLYYAANVLSIDLPPLRTRGPDLPALIQVVADTVVASLGVEPISFSPAALNRLRHYLWFGNLAELEAVLTRTIAFARGPTIDAKDLLFGYGPILPRLVSPNSVTQSAAAEPSAGNGAMVDLIIQELAHEFRNPMVTIKTFAQHLDRLLTQENGEAQVVRLTGDAIARMDGALENLVQFTRFQEPAPQATSILSLVAAALRSIEERLAEKQLVMTVEPSAAEVFVDPAQLTYAIRSLLQNIVRELNTGDALVVRSPRAGALTVEYPATAWRTARTLSALVSNSLDADGALPLGISLAKTLVERNGGTLTIHRGADPAMITLELPRGAEGMERDGQAESTHC